jgi:hypothetical protein
MRGSFVVLSFGIVAIVASGACGGAKKGFNGFGDDGGSSSSGGSGGSGGGSGGSSGGNLVGDGGGDDGGGMLEGDPTTCTAAASSHSYIGCDYWPTVTANNVWSIFDFAVVVANGQTTQASVTVTGPSSTNQTVTVDPGSLTKIYLPWVAPLKGADTDSCGLAVPLGQTPAGGTNSGTPASVLARAAAYHLVASVPVTVYQFSALEYAPTGGPPGKDWSTCPGTTTACPITEGGDGMPITCFSFSNDASLLLPSTAMTGNYRVTGHPSRLPRTTRRSTSTCRPPVRSWREATSPPPPRAARSRCRSTRVTWRSCSAEGPSRRI